MKIHWHNIPLYRTSVGFCFGVPVKKFNDYMTKYGEREKDDMAGCCITLKAENGHSKYIVYVEDFGDFESLGHEIFHVATRILTDRGALQKPEDDEQGAYLCGYLTGLAVKNFKK